ncbi:MAG TPA: hypothetical protein VF487_20640 [Chitinophagaceae bacterium]
MKRIHFLFILVLLGFSNCGKDNFYDRFVPEILYYQNADVENANFTEVTLPVGQIDWVVKARVSAPMHLKEIKVFKITGNTSETLLQTYTDFQLVPNVYKVNYTLTGIATETTVKILATDADNKSSTKNFKIKVQ